MFYFIYYLFMFAMSANITEAQECELTGPITDISGLEAIGSCEIINGNLEIESYNQPLLELTHLKVIRKDFIIRNSPELVRLEAPLLESIGGGLRMKTLTSLSYIDFPSLSSVKEIDWKVIPILSNVRLNGEISDVESVVISDTSLTGFSGFQSEKLKKLDINNNRFLDSLQSNVKTIEGKLHIASNGNSLKVGLSDLTSVTNVSINDVTELSLCNLQEIKESVSIINNRFSGLELPLLTKVGGTISISKNKWLNTVKFDHLKEINGGLMVINNSDITKLDFFPNLTKIDGGVELDGNFKSMSFPNLKLVKGSAKIKSSDYNFDCSSILKKELSTAIRGGKLECSTAGSSKDDGTGTAGSWGTRSTTSNGAKNGTKYLLELIFHILVASYMF